MDTDNLAALERGDQKLNSGNINFDEKLASTNSIQMIGKVGTDGESTGQCAKAPSVYHEAGISTNGKPKSIEVLTLSGETIEDCRKRIRAHWDGLQTKVAEYGIIGQILAECVEKDYSKFLPEWITPDLLYRINYGPITEAERRNVASFLYDQYYAIKCRRRVRTMSNLCRPFKNLLPHPWGPAPVRNLVQIGEDDFEDFQKEYWSKTVNTQPPVLIGFIDPPLASSLLSNVYPASEIIIDDAYHNFI